MKLRLQLIALFSCAVVCVVPRVAAQRGMGNVSGKVVSTQGGQPIRKAIVRLNGGEGDTAEEYTSATDVAGEFKLEGIPAGGYTISVTRSGYFPASTEGSPKQISVEAGQEVDGLLFKMDPAGVITGKIMDADGDPLPGIAVVAVQRSTLETTGSRAAGRVTKSGFTNDAGEYRVANLPAGMYVVVGQPEVGTSPAPNPADKGHLKRRIAYVDTYYPGVAEEKQAGVVLVRAGEAAAANFGLLTGATYRVSGSVEENSPGSVREIELMSRTASPLVAAVDTSGKFDFPSVRPGTYEARVTLAGSGDDKEALRHENIATPIEVSDGDLVDLELRPEERGVVSGKFRMDTPGEEKVDWALLSVTLMRLSAGPGEETGPDRVVNLDLPTSSALNDDGSFEVKDVSGGEYQLSIEAKSDYFRDYYTKSVMADGRETVDTGFAVKGGATLEVVLSANGASLEGTVTDEKGLPLVDAYVMTVPALGKRARPESYQRVQTRAKGTFEMHGINPGEFVLFAFKKMPGDVRDAGFLRKYGEKGVKVSLGEGEHKSVELVTVE